ncbi:MerR family DNA-binding transcriptional regulator [Halobacillus sp. A1]|uniref:MerR family transcriptional regulator n=1 Tax=Halobacillus sp. A1 TaxID=2880262 RepID=UPI0020A6B3A5|nr:MerR family DNA-binding transcriptional regulator [Halobacillus sp. A1]
MENKTISEVAYHYDVTARTIRYYEELGLISPMRNNGQRVFTQKEMTRLRLISRGKKYGFQLEEIKEMIQLFDQDPSGIKQLESVIQSAQRKMDEVEARIEELQLLKKEMNDWIINFNEELEKRKKEG